MRESIINALIAENKNLNANIDVLKTRAINLEENATLNQYGRQNNLEINGIDSCHGQFRGIQHFRSKHYIDY